MIEKDSVNFLKTKTNELLTCGDYFAYFSPCEQLRTFISNYTITFPDQGLISDDYTVVPHGSATLVFTHDGFKLQSQLFGPSSKPYQVGRSANECKSIFIIEFQPAGLYIFTGIKQKQLIDQIIPFKEIDPLLDTSIKKNLCDAVTAEELLANIESVLLCNQPYQYPAEFSLAMRLIIQRRGNISLKELTQETFYSERHLNRLFHHYLGFNIKHFSRIVRINRAIHLLHNKRNSLAYIAREFEFYDVSHFIKDFKAVCGITPQKYRENMSDFYSEIAKF